MGGICIKFKSVKGSRVGSGHRRVDIVLTSGPNKTLKIMGKHQTGLCEGCQEVEGSVERVLLIHRKYETQREVMRNRLRERGIREFTLKGLLGMGGRAQVRALLKFLRDKV